MNATHQALNAYAAAGAPLRSPRQAEYQVLSTATARLAAAEAANDFPRLAGALHDNGRLWTRLAADVADGSNGLPQELRARVFYLAEFTRAHSRRVLKGEAGVQALIDVNAAVMRGLSGPRAASPDAAPPDAPALRVAS